MVLNRVPSFERLSLASFPPFQERTFVVLAYLASTPSLEQTSVFLWKVDQVVHQCQLGCPHPTEMVIGSGMGLHPTQAKESTLEMLLSLISKRPSLLRGP